jgi:hypothetical protein
VIYKAVINTNPVVGFRKTRHFDAANFNEAVEKAEKLRKATVEDISAHDDHVRIVSIEETDIQMLEVELQS